MLFRSASLGTTSLAAKSLEEGRRDTLRFPLDCQLRVWERRPGEADRRGAESDSESDELMDTLGGGPHCSNDSHPGRASQPVAAHD